MQYIPGDYKPGYVVAVPVETSVGIVVHKGILSDRIGPDGLPYVIHAAKFFGAIVEGPMQDFMTMARGPLTSEGFPGKLPPVLVIARARALIGKPWKWRPWDNCEHFVHEAHGLPPKSPQVRRAGKSALGAAGVGAFVWFAFANA